MFPRQKRERKPPVRAYVYADGREMEAAGKKGEALKAAKPLKQRRPGVSPPQPPADLPETCAAPGHCAYALWL
jgi:hypothetical protein